jgi:hypothetical protein
MTTDQTKRIAELEEELRQLKQKQLEDLQEISLSYTEGINNANRLEKENHVLTLKLQAEVEKQQLKSKRPYSALSGWLVAILVGTLAALSKC